LLGGILLILAAKMKAEPPVSLQSTGNKVVRIIKVTPRQIQPTVIGYGHTRPASDWEAQTELDGSVIWTADNFREGNIFAKGAPILKIDPASYRLEIARLTAEIDVSRIRDQTISASLKIASEEYEIQRSEYNRSIELSKTGHISKTEKNKSKRELLSSQQQLQTLKNSLAINKAEHQVLLAQLALAERDLDQTTISAPFDLRITEKLVGLAEYVNKGEVLLRADGTDAVEISAQFPLGKMRPLHRANRQNSIEGELHNVLEAFVELKVGSETISWQGLVNRSGGQIDAQTQSQSIVVRIENPYQKALPGQKPPLIRDTFVKVILKAPVMKKQILIPVSALHQGNVYLVNNEGKLEIRNVEVDFIQNQIAVIKTGLQPNDKVILSQLSPAVKGMKLKALADEKIVTWLDKVTGFKASMKTKAENQS
jgi:RND family efflux transporter MFP subunit